ncbi:MAG TPA: ammonium transporter [Candidatus Eisenbergiella merdigallinarum]|uniref:Ammonium transporter n=1 Tax=Candidatus Eisenbergiella merdigallinarum TaxID=2838552 RepID=A0A9D2SC64_9FIRM|nr:ammonium transporter [Candidatus Eisenbergiella merdigallinarum]
MFSSTDVMWTLIGGILVFFMQAGFALCEAGLTRAKNTGNILMKNMMDFCIGTPCYWLVGFGLMFAGAGPLIGGLDPLIRGSYDFGSLPTWCYAFFQTVFCATAATIVSGSMAERTNFKAYCLYSAAISLVVYPISGHWIWGGGWLSVLNFHDFAGSACVHMVGGLVACLGAAILGPRIGKYGKDGKARAIPGHNMTACALGVFILWFCWFGFNGGSTVAMSTDADMELASLVMFNTNMAAAVATCVAMIFTWLRYGKPDVSMTFNAALAGLVAVTAGCDCVTPVGAFFIGAVAGILVVLSVEFFDNIAKIDDPVGAISVHMVNGMWGTIAVGLFSNGGDGVGVGLFYGGGLRQLGVQLLGIVTVSAYVLAVMFVIFKLIDKTVGLRVPAEVEIDGLDIHEHGLVSAYAGFAISEVSNPDMEINENTDLGEDDIAKATKRQIDAAVKVVKSTTADGAGETGMHKVSIICRLSRFDALKKKLNDLGVTGITMTQVMGCGVQRGSSEKYRGVEMDANLLPKIKVEVVISKIPVDSVISAAKEALYTGHIGDGKIFVYDVARVVKVRTGEEDYAALQDVE